MTSRNDELRDLVLQQLEPLPATSRAMFGGFGLYLDGKFFGVISDGAVYFRTDDVTREQYVARGMRTLQPPRYRPRGPKTVDRNFEVPADVLANPARMRDWARAAAATNARAGAKHRRRQH